MGCLEQLLKTVRIKMLPCEAIRRKHHPTVWYFLPSKRVQDWAVIIPANTALAEEKEISLRTRERYNGGNGIPKGKWKKIHLIGWGGNWNNAGIKNYRKGPWRNNGMTCRLPWEQKAWVFGGMAVSHLKWQSCRKNDSQMLVSPAPPRNIRKNDSSVT